MYTRVNYPKHRDFFQIHHGQVCRARALENELVVLAAVAQDGEAFKLAPDAGPSQVKGRNRATTI